jgi:hypothetical protein
MAFTPPDSPRRRDRGREEAARRQRARLARDLGDEHGQAWAHQMPRPKRSKFTLIVGAIFIAFVVLGALPLVLRSGDGQLVQPNCTTPAVATGPAKITPGTNFAWQAAGPQQGPYVLALDAASVTGPVGGPIRPDNGRVLSAPLTLTGCRSPQTLAAGPDNSGTHEVALFRHTGTTWTRVAVSLLEVS